ncbi:hypothetical protein COY31_02660 [Candidatus Wolfebacteria bacterium CG_4_10_14_0_2_um_filter_39_18]|uniref:Methyltransferase FkbM domain-containing protein n=1 Tax=Candidatus Wolfebacteria bacterium CG_4_10_14_0_2_um_filter_39_18 TaxID=1975061 RepID=A0A2M7TF30_9BACT|nr:MAG: hypothetical protein COV90_01740 [Candidatus Tagabacteria bacterium CG11_big_fil_rev_8_21_14_0_20_41_11]PIZ44422.1 MAG: hypothetical protein COY31_02660 [Candidatus Wolfebacteria bacterium CG_4_10_14_0_2_um_filter_39_18]
MRRLKNILKRVLPQDVCKFLISVRYLNSILRDRRKQEIIKKFQKKAGVKFFVETGTYKGDMVDAVKSHFDNVYSIELGKELYENAKLRFADSNKVHILNGDSVTVLPSLLRTINEKSLFWLDAHYSGGDTARGKEETPITEELNTILTHSVYGHVVLIDDARLFDGNNGYPKIEDVESRVKAVWPNYVVESKMDIIRIYPQNIL